MNVYPVPATSTLGFGDIYSGAGTFAPSVEAATNPAPTQVGKNAPGEASKKNAVSNAAAAATAGLEVPMLITLGVLAFFLIYRY